MKKLIYFVFIAIFLQSCVTSKYHNTEYPNPFEFQKIDSLNGLKVEIFVKANEWVAKTFNSAKDVIQMHDKDAGKIIAKGVMTSVSSTGLASSVTYYISYTLSIDAKDSKCRVVLSDYIVTEGVFTGGGKTANYPFSEFLSNDGTSGKLLPKGIYPKAWLNIKGDCYNKSIDLLESFNKFMNSKSDNF